MSREDFAKEAGREDVSSASDELCNCCPAKNVNFGAVHATVAIGATTIAAITTA